MSARQAVKNVINECIVCKKYNARAFHMPPTPALPSKRVNITHPFCYTGVDYTGNFTVKEMIGNKIKAYILLFTCMSTRATYLELVFSLSVESFIMAFIRFSNWSAQLCSLGI